MLNMNKCCVKQKIKTLFNRFWSKTTKTFRVQISSDQWIKRSWSPETFFPPLHKKLSTVMKVATMKNLKFLQEYWSPQPRLKSCIDMSKLGSSWTWRAGGQVQMEEINFRWKPDFGKISMTSFLHNKRFKPHISKNLLLFSQTKLSEKSQIFWH